jgi:hypothetical protein
MRKVHHRLYRLTAAAAAAAFYGESALDLFPVIRTHRSLMRPASRT